MNIKLSLGSMPADEDRADFKKYRDVLHRQFDSLFAELERELHLVVAFEFGGGGYRELCVSIDDTDKVETRLAYFVEHHSPMTYDDNHVYQRHEFERWDIEITFDSEFPYLKREMIVDTFSDTWVNLSQFVTVKLNDVTGDAGKISAEYALAYQFNDRILLVYNKQDSDGNIIIQTSEVSNWDGITKFEE